MRSGTKAQAREVLKALLDFHQGPANAITQKELAERCSISVRELQEAIQYLRQ